MAESHRYRRCRRRSKTGLKERRIGGFRPISRCAGNLRRPFCAETCITCTRMTCMGAETCLGLICYISSAEQVLEALRRRCLACLWGPGERRRCLWEPSTLEDLESSIPKFTDFIRRRWLLDAFVMSPLELSVHRWASSAWHMFVQIPRHTHARKGEMPRFDMLRPVWFDHRPSFQPGWSRFWESLFCRGPELSVLFLFSDLEKDGVEFWCFVTLL